MLQKHTVPKLSEILNNGSGIIDVDTVIENLLSKQLIDFDQIFLKSFPNTVVPEFIFNVYAFKKNIQQYLDEGLTHLGFYFGIETKGESPNVNTIRLIMVGTELDKQKPHKTPKSSPMQFSDADLSLLRDNIIKHNSMRSNFKNELIKQRLIQYNHGLYIKLDDLKTKLDKIEALSFDDFIISLGFRSAETVGLWNCIHLIFRGATPSSASRSMSDSNSEILFSTFDANDLNYDGPKLGVPPFGEA